ncbi:MAG: molecular chaperone DnaK [Deltaproteobacteria bacterium]|nr:molecular chaperone DnaK [Deltaproteobacteria bacterium]
MSRVIGIDLGTTNSCVSLLDSGKPTVIPNSEGARTTPSVVAFSKTNERLVGQIAKRQAVTNSTRTIHAVKRLIGRKFNDEMVVKSKTILPYQIAEAKNSDAWVQVDDKSYSPSEISGMVLKKMKEVAEDYLGQEVKEAVITVPAYFNDAQRQATKDAGKIAGLNVLRILNEPTAAALAYGLDKQGAEKIAVFDLGGGTFDISVLELSDGVYQVKSTNGDTFLGGEDFDHRIMTFLIDKFKESEKIDLATDPLALQRIKEAAEKAKHELSSSDETTIELPFITATQGAPKHLKLSLTRTQLNELCKDLIDRLEGPCKTAMTDAGLKPEEIHKVLLVGGMTRMPAVQAKVKAIFGKDGDHSINPDEVVAIGASIQGGVLTGEVTNVVLLDVTPLSLGVETAGGVFTKIIEKNTSIPTMKSKTFTTAADNQSFVNVHVLQGERELANFNKTLAKFELTDIPPAPRGVPQIDVTFSIDSNGIVNVKATDMGTGKEQSIRITASSGLSESEIKKIVQEAQDYAESDAKQKELTDAVLELEGLIFTAEKSIHEFKDELPAEIAERAITALAQAKKALESTDVEFVRSSKAELNEAAHAMAEHIYGKFADTTN